MICVDNKNSYRGAKIVSLVCRNRIENGMLPVIDGSKGAYELYYMCARLRIHPPPPTERTKKKLFE